MAAAAGARNFDLGFLGREPFRSLLPGLIERLRRFQRWPHPTEYDGLVASVEAPAFVPYDAASVRAAGGYEAHVARHRRVPTRERDWHDFFNMVVWAHSPRTRWALNTLHVTADPAAVDPGNGRTPVQNLAAQFDECGLVVLSSDTSVLTGLRELRFKEVFWERRRTLATSTRFVMVGHGSLEALLRPHLGLTSKALLMPLTQPPPTELGALYALADEWAARAVSAWTVRPPEKPSPVHPVPLLGIPEWYDGQTAFFYENPNYFRSQRWASRAQRHVGNTDMP